MHSRNVSGFDSAIAAARKGLSEGQVPIGASYFASESQRSSAHTMTCEGRSPIRHAEILAFEAASFSETNKSENGELFTTVEPCLMCLGAALNVGVKKIWYLLDAAGDGSHSIVSLIQRIQSNSDPLTLSVKELCLQRGDVVKMGEALELMKRFVQQFPHHAHWEYAKAIVDINERRNDA